MELLFEIFPSLSEDISDDIPIWLETSKPWKILEDDENGIQAQITDRIKNDGDFKAIHPTAKIGDYVSIEGACYIGPGAEIKNGAFLRRGSWICSGAIVGHCSEVKILFYCRVQRLLISIMSETQLLDQAQIWGQGLRFRMFETIEERSP